jgi:glycine cleavage system H protein
VGVTDYVQQSLSDIMFFTPPTVGTEVEQFGEVGTIESGKAVFEVISPVSGKVTAVNEGLVSAPERINQNPYEKGWIAELELSDFASDRELLLDFEGYFKIMKRKVDEFHVKKS